MRRIAPYMFMVFALGFVVSLGAQEAAIESPNAETETVSGTVLVAGATGRTGRFITEQLVAKGYNVRAMTRRDLTDAADTFGQDYDWVQGDVRDVDTLKLAMEGVTHVICAIGSTQSYGPNSPEYVDYGGVRNLADVAKEFEVKHFVLVSSMGVTQQDHFLNKVRGNVLIWKFLGEEHLRRSGLNYTIVRPSGLQNMPGGVMSIELLQGDDPAKQGLVTRADVAAVTIEALSNEGAVNKTFEITNGDVNPEDNWPDRLADLKADTVGEAPADDMFSATPETPPTLQTTPPAEQIQPAQDNSAGE